MAADGIGKDGFRGIERQLRVFPGAVVSRVTHPSGQSIQEHQHDWPNLTVHVLGSCTEQYDGGSIRLAGPSAILHPPGSAHADTVDAHGLETLGIMFDPAWLRGSGFDARIDQPLHWVGGPASAAARRLVVECSRRDSSEAHLAAATARFLTLACSETPAPTPRWLETVFSALENGAPTTTHALARRLDLHPAWLARAYRHSTGEGLQETIRRKRVEKAALLLRESDHTVADIALLCGFCDQAHMNRNFRAVLDRTPLAVRLESVTST